ncbi:MAG: hypothetical protein HGA24_06845, partial [Candidatus Aminicenantes bacterium]|nr:hypothetical protein [Candidatus Aminicenantes bacterium]
MKETLAIIIALFLLAAGPVFSQTVIENPAKPLANDAGRVIALKESWRITDESGEFYFKVPSSLKIANDGSIFIRDIGQFLKFRPDGTFLKNLFKQGQGPGEVKGDVFHYDLRGQSLFVLDRNARRFWRADLEGRFQESIDIAAIVDPELVSVLPEGPLFLTFKRPGRDEFTGKSGAVPHALVLAGQSGRTTRDLLKFTRSFLFAPNHVLFDELILTPSPDRKVLYMFNGWNYRINVIDSISGRIAKRITRVYPKSRLTLTEEQEKRRQEMGMPRYEFMPDISNLYPTADGIW